MQLRPTLRRLANSPGFTLTTLLTLAIGIGATTAIFSVVNGILIKPLPFADADRLVALTHSIGIPDDDEVHNASPAIYFTYRDNSQAFQSVALWWGNVATVTGVGDPEEVQAVRATQEYLPTLRVAPMLGRGFTADDDEPGKPRTVILSHTYWQRRFGGADDIVGRSITIDGQPHEVVGVLPATFRFLEQQADVLIPAQLVRATAIAGPIGEHGIARLKDGVTLGEASADVSRMIPILFDTFPLVQGLPREAATRMGPDLRLLKDLVVGDLADVLWVLMGTIVMLLLIACANVANLELVRTEARTQELAIRAALGAGGAVIARALLAESLILALAGGALGLGLAMLGLPVLLTVAAAQLPSALDIGIDSTVLAGTLIVSVACALLFGLIPSPKLGAPRALAALRGAAHSFGTSRESHRARNTLVIVQVSLALVLLVAAGLMIRTFQALRDVDSGIGAPDRVQVLRLAVPQRPASGVSVPRMQNDIEEGLAAVAGVESVGFSNRVPLANTGPSGPFMFESAPGAAPRETEFRNVSPGFIPTLDAPLVAGRHLEWADTYEARPAVVVSENLANEQWGSAAAAVGQRMRRGPNGPWLEVVGVVGDIRHYGLEQPAPGVVYLPQDLRFAQFASRVVFFFVRSDRVGTAGFTEELARAIWSVDPALPLGSVETLGDVYRRAMARTSLTLVLLTITAAMALLLGLLGIYGVVSYMLNRRTHEIGVRMALGAQHAALRGMLFRQVLLLVGVGVALGLGGAALLTRALRSLLFGVTALDPVTYVVGAAAVAAAAALAAYWPARRVTRVNPMHALRAE